MLADFQAGVFYPFDALLSLDLVALFQPEIIIVSFQLLQICNGMRTVFVKLKDSLALLWKTVKRSQNGNTDVFLQMKHPFKNLHAVKSFLIQSKDHIIRMLLQNFLQCPGRIQIILQLSF